ncbi:hypothetical protein DKX38_012452 [Salix brachista]|uniref:Uncharacterized protein n=1 Tax=Salix brachista TaxID=2182728 RepID=A0A5N5LNV0_9ROSI|nr:hypothetical protein DKX38_012452 [Salix brachista]
MSLASSNRRYRNRLRVFCFLMFFVEHLNLNHQGSSPAPVRDRRVPEDEITGKFEKVDLRRREIVVDTEDEVMKDAVFEQGVRPHYTEED